MENSSSSSWNTVEAQWIIKTDCHQLFTGSQIPIWTWFNCSSWHLRCFLTQKYRPVMWNLNFNASFNTIDHIPWKFYHFALKHPSFFVSKRSSCSFILNFNLFFKSLVCSCFLLSPICNHLLLDIYLLIWFQLPILYTLFQSLHL